MGKLKYTVIKTKAQYDEYCRILKRLNRVTALNKVKEEEIELLHVLIRHWNDRENRYWVEDPVKVLKALMKKHKLETSNLMFILDIRSRGYISDMLNYKKGFSKKVIRRLSLHFNVPQEAFNRQYELKSSAQTESHYQEPHYNDVWAMDGAW